MNYKPGTILSFGEENDNTYQEAIVVTNGNLFIKQFRQIMSVSDWFIINKNQNIKVVPSEPSEKKFNYKPRSLIRWFGKNCRRTAVVLYEGALLQVKKVDGDVVTQDHTFFVSYDEWAASFPSEGDVYYYKS